MNDSPVPRKIVFLLFTDTHLMDLAGPAQVFYEAQQLGNAEFEIRFASLSRKVSTAQGLQLSDLVRPEELPLSTRDFIVVPGTDFASFMEGELEEDIAEIRPWLTRQLESGVQVASICSGALILAEAGLLDGRRCTSHWKCVEYLREHHPLVHTVSDRLFVHDGNIYTSAGMTSGIDMSLAILEKLYGPVLTARVAREMVVFMRRDEGSTQESIYLEYRTHFNPAIHRVQDYLLSHTSENPTLETLSDLAHMSPRNLTRLFKEVTGHTITDFKHMVKTEVAAGLLNNPEFSMEQVAQRCGYENSRQLRRIWKRYRDTTPSEYRRRK